MSYLYLCLDIRNILYEFEDSYAATNNSETAKDTYYWILTIFLKYRLFLFISEYDMCLSIMYVL
jgi:hypothetical protein